MKRKYFMPSISFMFWAMAASSQIPQEPKNVQSPNAAELGLFGEMPVSQFSGIPSISIPIHTFEQNKITIPISLDYHASGVRPEMHPGWVGLGWMLSAGGSITRTVNDVPDEFPNNIYHATLSNEKDGYFNSLARLDQTNWSDRDSVVKWANEIGDTEPDEFSFSFPGGSGKFYLDHHGSWKVKSSKPITVSLLSDMGSSFLSVPASIHLTSRSVGSTDENFKSFSGFIITDENGNKYIFGGTTDAIEYSIDMWHQKEDEWVAQAWNLVKIISAEGAEVDLTYERDDYIAQMYLSIHNVITAASGGHAYCSQSQYTDLYQAIQGKLISPVYLSKIESTNTVVTFSRSTSTELGYDDEIYSEAYHQWYMAHGSVVFPYGTGNDKFLPILAQSTDCPGCEQLFHWKKLDHIYIADNKGGLTTPEEIRSFSLTYNNDVDERLELLSVQEHGSGDSEKPPYIFSYDDSQTLPPYLANETDHWGFYNGTFADISNHSTYYSTFYGYKNSNETYLYAGILNKTTYPTGGVTEFIYEANQYGKRLAINRSDGIDPSFSTNTMAGGLRIKKIVSYNTGAPDQKTTKEYFYVTNFSNAASVPGLLSSGVLTGQPKYYFDDFNTVYHDQLTNAIITMSMTIFSSQSILPASNNTQGCHVGYSEVTERDADGSYTKYFFSNFDNGRVDEAGEGNIQASHTPYEPVASLEEERGQLLKQEEYSSADVLLHKREIGYTAINKANEYVRAMRTSRELFCSSWPGSILEGNAYKFYTFSYLPTSETETTYDQSGGNPVVVSRSFVYDDETRLLKEESSTNSLGILQKKNYTYCYDYPATTATSDKQTIFREMAFRHMIAMPVEIVESDRISGVDKVKGSTLTTFSKDPVTGIIAPDHLLRVDARTYLSSFTPSSVEFLFSTNSEYFQYDPAYKPILSFNKYDQYGNLVEFQKTNDAKTVYLWGYNGQYIVAKVVGSDYETVSGFVDLSDLDNTTSSVSLVQGELNNLLSGLYGTSAQVSTYVYKPMVGIISETDFPLRKRYYEYDDLGRLLLVKDQDRYVIESYQYNYK